MLGEFPSISVVTPTLNAAKVLEDCLCSIRGQDYPQELVEIIIADGGSTDRTLEIAKKYKAKIFPNKLRTGESGKAVGIKNSQNEIIASIDSDNILPHKDWFRQMVAPFKDEEVLVSEPLYFTHRPEDGFITRYCALIGMNDPLVLFLGNYDRYSHLTDRWTGLDIGEIDDRGDYLFVKLKQTFSPTIGANGALFRRSFIEDVGVGTHVFDIDVIPKAIKMGRIVPIAKVKTGIVHIYCGSDIKQFIKKQNRRIKDFGYNQKIGSRAYDWHKQNKLRLALFILASGLVAPTLFQAVRGYSRKKDPAWFFHPLACLLTLLVYSKGYISGLFSASEADRENWRQ